MAAKKASKKGKRYTEAEKAEILGFIEKQGRGGATLASKKYGISPLTLTNWKKAAGKGAAKSKVVAPDKDEVLKALAAKGFKIVRSMNMITGEILEDKIDPKIEKLNLAFGGLGGRADDATTYVTATGKQILVTLTLDRLLALTGTKP